MISIKSSLYLSIVFLSFSCGHISVTTVSDNEPVDSTRIVDGDGYSLVTNEDFDSLKSTSSKAIPLDEVELIPISTDGLYSLLSDKKKSWVSYWAVYCAPCIQEASFMVNQPNMNFEHYILLSVDRNSEEQIMQTKKVMARVGIRKSYFLNEKTSITDAGNRSNIKTLTKKLITNDTLVGLPFNIFFEGTKPVDYWVGYETKDSIEVLEKYLSFIANE